MKPSPYKEPLPDGCPPDTAEEIVEPRRVFRLIRSDVPTDDDFHSLRAENPTRVYRGLDECRVRGLSVFGTRNDCEQAARLPRLRGRSLCRVNLVRGAGRIRQTGQWSHHTWWPLARFDILAHCEP